MTQQPAFGATPFGTYKRKLMGRSWTDDWKNRPVCELDIISNNPRFSIFTNNPREAEKTIEIRPGFKKPMGQMPIVCRMGPQDLEKILILFKEVAASPSPVGFEVRFRGPVYKEGEKVQGEFETKTILTFGRDAEGVIYIQFAEKGRDKPTFIFSKNTWVPIKKEGADFTPVEDSTLEFQSWINSIERVLGPIYVNYFVPEERRQKPQVESQEVQTIASVCLPASRVWG